MNSCGRRGGRAKCLRSVLGRSVYTLHTSSLVLWRLEITCHQAQAGPQLSDCATQTDLVTWQMCKVERSCCGKVICAVNYSTFTWSVSKGVQGPRGQGNTHAVCPHWGGSMCSRASPQVSDGGDSMFRAGLVGSLFSGPGHTLCPDPVPDGQSQPPCPTTKLK